MLYTDFVLVLRYTRRWIHYGFLFHIVTSILIAGIQGLLEAR